MGGKERERWEKDGARTARSRKQTYRITEEDICFGKETNQKEEHNINQTAVVALPGTPARYIQAGEEREKKSLIAPD